MLRISKLTDYGTMILAQLPLAGSGLTSAGDVAAATHLTQATVSKLLKVLLHAGLVVSTRGAQGGYALSRPAHDITAAQIIDALEGPVAITECSAEQGHCDLESFCPVGKSWQRVNLGIRRALAEISLADLRTNAHPLRVPDLRASLVAPAGLRGQPGLRN
jgi:FeS assembly SUF system regulator